MSITSTLAIAAGALALGTAATYLLPRSVHVERVAVIDAEPAEVLALAASNTGYQVFNPYKAADPDLKIDIFGPETGVGSGFHFDGKDGKGTLTVAKITDDAVVYAIDLGPMGQPTQTISVRAVDGGTEVTWSVDADMGMNPVFRVFGLFMDGMMGKTFDQGLSNLADATA